MATTQRTTDEDALRIANYLRERLNSSGLGITINSVRDVDVKDYNTNDFPMIVVYRTSWEGYRCDISKMICKLILTQSAGNGGVRFNNLALAIHEILHDFQHEPDEKLDIDSYRIRSTATDINILEKSFPSLVTTFSVTHKDIDGGVAWPGFG
jgi:hypothetical protein